MALKATVYKAALQVADLDRGHFGEYALTLARHPSETDERLMTRLLAFALFADADLAFGRGISTEDEPALWSVDPAGVIKTWIELGQPDESRIRKACGRAEHVVIVAYGARAVDVWWSQNSEALGRLDQLQVLRVTAEDLAALGRKADRNMKIDCTIQEGTVYWDDLVVQPEILKPGGVK